jgi:hypothetical protein
MTQRTKMAHKHKKTQVHIDPAISNAMKSAAALRPRMSKTDLIEEALLQWLAKEEPGLYEQAKARYEEEKEED